MFPVPKIAFPVFSPKIPCSDAQGVPSKALRFSAHFGNMDTATGQSSQISLYFSLLAGNLGRRLVCDGLCGQPASAVS
jgi:hypothetical protein